MTVRDIIENKTSHAQMIRDLLDHEWKLGEFCEPDGYIPGDFDDLVVCYLNGRIEAEDVEFVLMKLEARQ